MPIVPWFHACTEFSGMRELGADPAAPGGEQQVSVESETRSKLHLGMR